MRLYWVLILLLAGCADAEIAVRLGDSEISISGFESGSVDISEFYELKNFVETNSYHENDPVFTHTLNMLRAYEAESFPAEIEKRLDGTVVEHTRGELLYLAILFHDIAKPETFVDNGNTTSCPGHEELGAEKAGEILDRFGLSEDEKQIITDLIRYHGNMNYVAGLENSPSSFKEEHEDIYPELAILAIMDAKGSQLKEKDSKKYYRIVNGLGEELKKYTHTKVIEH